MSAPPHLPFVPWWYHANHRYEGKHRGTYQFQDLSKPLPYDLRSIKLTPYAFGMPSPIKMTFADVKGFETVGTVHSVSLTDPKPDPYISLIDVGKSDISITMQVYNINPDVWRILIGEEPRARSGLLRKIAAWCKRFARWL